MWLPHPPRFSEGGDRKTRFGPWHSARPMKTHDISALESVLGHHFRRAELLEQALTHSSQAREQESLQPAEPRTRVGDNEQLEFLGDAVLGFVTSETLFQR